PIKGYSLTVPVGNHKGAPTVCAIDENNLVAITPFGDRVRVTATAEFAGYDTSHKPSDFAFMKGVVQELYPDGGDYDRAEMGGGPRADAPDHPADLWPEALKDPLFHPRARPYRLDHVARLGPHHRRPHRRQGPGAGDRGDGGLR